VPAAFFVDAIFAIAATLLLLDVSVHAPAGSLGVAIKHAWPQYAAYGVSFLIIGIWWLNHHHCMKLIVRADRTFLFANIALLACIAFLPFPKYARPGEGLRPSALSPLGGVTSQRAWDYEPG
jgi:uncharacterized membrane protein